jgi:hypothetical protein
MELDGKGQFALCRSSGKAERHPDLGLGVEARLLEASS